MAACRFKAALFLASALLLSQDFASARRSNSEVVTDTLIPDKAAPEPDFSTYESYYEEDYDYDADFDDFYSIDEEE